MSDAPAATAVPLFRQVLGGFLDQTPACVRRLHGGAACATYRGEAEVERARGLLAQARIAQHEKKPAQVVKATKMRMP